MCAELRFICRPLQQPNIRCVRQWATLLASFRQLERSAEHPWRMVVETSPRSLSLCARVGGKGKQSSMLPFYPWQSQKGSWGADSRRGTFAAWLCSAHWGCMRLLWVRLVWSGAIATSLRTNGHFIDDYRFWGYRALVGLCTRQQDYKQHHWNLLYFDLNNFSAACIVWIILLDLVTYQTANLCHQMVS